jgi:OOP family OmpA-OmpF porin
LYGTGNWDSLINLGVSYAFGSSRKATVAPMAATNPDSDGDGVLNSQDNCPNTPAGASVDTNGCALDSDGDGVPDYRDRCLNTPEGYEVNNDGCMLTRAKEVSFDLSLRFAHDSDVLQDYDREDVQRVASYLKENSSATGLIEGHTDSTGSAAYNLQLSERRAKAVEKLLVKQYGVEASRLSSAGYGEERPIADNNTAAGRDANRRVVAKVKGQTEENIKK